MTLSDKRQEWLRGAYADRVLEMALELQKSITEFVDSAIRTAASERLRGHYDYLIDLTAEEQTYLEEHTVDVLLSRLRDDHDYALRQKYALQMRQAAGLFQMDSADAVYHFDESAFDASMARAFADLDVTDDDRGMMREIVLRYLWPRLRHAHGNLRSSAVDHLKRLNPESISPHAEFAVDVGWMKLAQHAASRIEMYPAAWKVQIRGGKEKFGCLVLHIGCDYSARGCRSEVERLREEIRLRSLATCEVCGALGRLRLSSFAKTVCDRHVGILGDLREDDGLWSDPWKWHEDGDQYPSEAAELLKDLEPVRPRPKEQHVVDLFKLSDIGKRIDEDTWKRSGREQELLIEFGYALEDSAKGACVKVEYLNEYIWNEIGGWKGVQPLSDEDREFLQGYLRGLIDFEYERIRRKQEREIIDHTLPSNEVGNQIERDLGRLVHQQGLLVEIAAALEVAVTAALSVSDEYIDDWLRDEVERLHGVQSLSEDDREWLHRYLRNLVIDQGARRLKRASDE